MPSIPDVKSILANAAAAKNAATQSVVEASNAAATVADAPPPATPPVADEAPATPPEPYFRVQLQDNFPFVIQAEDRYEAVEKYNAKCGILSTLHKHSIERATKADFDECQRQQRERAPKPKSAK